MAVFTWIWRIPKKKVDFSCSCWSTFMLMIDAVSKPQKSSNYESLNTVCGKNEWGFLLLQPGTPKTAQRTPLKSVGVIPRVHYNENTAKIQISWSQMSLELVSSNSIKPWFYVPFTMLHCILQFKKICWLAIRRRVYIINIRLTFHPDRLRHPVQNCITVFKIGVPALASYLL